MRFARIGDWLVRLTLLIVGASAGAGLVVLVQSSADSVLNTGLIAGMAAGVGAFVLALLFYVVIRPAKIVARDEETKDTDAPALDAATLRRVLDRLGLPDVSETALIREVKTQGLGLTQMVLRLWSSAAALGTAVAITGSVIAMVTAIAALRQVERIDAQNALIEQQIVEAQASRAAGVFAAQLPSLLAAIDAERPKPSENRAERVALLSDALQDLSLEPESAAFQRAASVMSEELGLKIQIPFDGLHKLGVELSVKRQVDRLSQEVDRTEQTKWRPSRALQARIQAVIDTAEPYTRDPLVDAAVLAFNGDLEARNAGLDPESGATLRAAPLPDMTFSPQRGQLFQLLVAAGIDFENMQPGFDFSQTDFRGLNLAPPSVQDSNILFGINLSRSNLRGSRLDRTQLIGTDLRGAVLDDYAQINAAGTVFEDGDEATFPMAHAITRFDDAILIAQEDVDVARRRGWLGNAISLAPGGRKLWSDPDVDEDLPEKLLSVPGGHGGNALVYHNIRQEVVLNDRTVFRMGSAAYVDAFARLTEQMFSRAFLNNAEAMSAGIHAASFDCELLAGPELDEIRRLIWWSEQPDAHPKWKWMVEFLRLLRTDYAMPCFQPVEGSQEVPFLVQNGTHLLK